MSVARRGIAWSRRHGACGYRGVARSSGRRARQVTVGLIIKAPHGDAPEINRFYAPVMTGIEEICRIREVDLLFAAMPVDDQYYPLEVPRLVTERSTDGLIVVGAHLSHGTTAILEDGPPAILVDAYAEDVAFDFVVSDNVGGGPRGDGAPHQPRPSRDRARRQPAGLVSEHPAASPRLRASDGRGGAHASVRRRLAHVPPEAAAAAALQYVRAHPEVTAAFCSNDAIAVALIQGAQRADIDVPGALSVVGYDDIDLARFVSPQLTTMAVDKLGMGRLAVTMLLHRLEFSQAAVIQALIRPRLVERGSVRTIETLASTTGEARPDLIVTSARRLVGADRGEDLGQVAVRQARDRVGRSVIDRDLCPWPRRRERRTGRRRSGRPRPARTTPGVRGDSRARAR